jgi:hypothetical protein
MDRPYGALFISDNSWYEVVDRYEKIQELYLANAPLRDDSYLKKWRESVGYHAYNAPGRDLTLCPSCGCHLYKLKDLCHACSFSERISQL